jgi:hypothetical protein
MEKSKRKEGEEGGREKGREGYLPRGDKSVASQQKEKERE